MRLLAFALVVLALSPTDGAWTSPHLEWRYAWHPGLEKQVMSAATASPVVPDEPALTAEELRFFTPYALAILAGEKTLRDVIEERPHVRWLTDEIIEALVAVDEMYVEGHFRLWCETRPGTDEAQLTAEQLRDACDTMPADAPRVGDVDAGDGGEQSTSAVIIPVVMTVFAPADPSMDMPSERHVRNNFAQMNNIFGGFQWREGFANSRTPPRDGPRPDTRLRFELSALKFVSNPEYAECPLGVQRVADHDGSYGFPGTDVINVFVCEMKRTAGGYAGFFGSVFLATMNMQGMPDQGLPFSGLYMQSMSLAHEFGHALCLHHTFQGACGLEGDEVGDTPPERPPAGGFHDCAQRVDWDVDLYLQTMESKVDDHLLSEEMKQSVISSFLEYGYTPEQAEAAYQEWLEQSAAPPKPDREEIELMLTNGKGRPQQPDTCPTLPGLDPVYNVMSYSMCGVRFSDGQIRRMQAFGHGSGPLSTWMHRRSLFDPSAVRRRWWVVGIGKCSAAQPAVQQDAEHLSACLALAERTAPSAGEAVAAFRSSGADCEGHESHGCPGECVVHVDGGACRAGSELDDDGSRWLTYAPRSAAAAELEGGWVAGSGSTAAVHHSTRALEPGAPLVVYIVQDPFLTSDDNWAALYEEGAPPSSSATPVGGVEWKLGELPVDGADETGHRLTRRLEISAPAQAGVYAVRLHCCGGYSSLLSEREASAARFLVSEDSAARAAFQAAVAREEGPGGATDSTPPEPTSSSSGSIAVALLAIVALVVGVYAADHKGWLPAWLKPYVPPLPPWVLAALPANARPPPTGSAGQQPQPPGGGASAAAAGSAPRAPPPTANKPVAGGCLPCLPMV